MYKKISTYYLLSISLLSTTCTYAENYQIWHVSQYAKNKSAITYIDLDSIKVKQIQGYYVISNTMKTINEPLGIGYTGSIIQNALNDFNRLGCCIEWGNKCDKQLNQVNSILKRKGANLTKYTCTLNDDNSYTSYNNSTAFIIDKNRLNFYVPTSKYLEFNSAVKNKNNQLIFTLLYKYNGSISSVIKDSINVTEKADNCRLIKSQTQSCIGYLKSYDAIKKYINQK